VSSNVLYKNSAVAHQTLAMRIHRMVEARHAERLAQRKAERAAAKQAAEAVVPNPPVLEGDPAIVDGPDGLPEPEGVDGPDESGQGDPGAPQIPSPPTLRTE